MWNRKSIAENILGCFTRIFVIKIASSSWRFEATHSIPLPFGTSSCFSFEALPFVPNNKNGHLVVCFQVWLIPCAFLTFWVFRGIRWASSWSPSLLEFKFYHQRCRLLSSKLDMFECFSLISLFNIIFNPSVGLSITLQMKRFRLWRFLKWQHHWHCTFPQNPLLWCRNLDLRLIVSKINGPS
jgi:hypothetical protein